MNSNIMVSIICITYNHEKYIAKALERMVRQKTNFRFEIIIHDDASTDNTPIIIREYQRSYPYIIKTVFEDQNLYSQKINFLKNSIYPLVKGRYIAYCEGDDYWIDEYKLQAQVDFMERHQEYSGCAHNTVVLNCKTNERTLLNTIEKCDQIMEANRILEWPIWPCFHMNSIVIRKECIKFVEKLEYGITSFGDMVIALAMALSGKVYYFNKPMSLYRKFVKDSWTTKNLKHKEIELETRKQICLLYQCFDKLTNEQYHNKVMDCTLRQGFSIAVLSGEKYKLFFPRFWKLLREKTIFDIYILLFID